MSTVSESKPWWAMTSAEKPVGIDSHPFTTASPFFQIALSVFSLTSLSSWSRAELRPADRPEVAPAADAEVLGLLEVGEHRDVRLGVHEVRLHGAHGQPELLLDLLEALGAPLVGRHHGLSEVRLHEVHPRRLDAEDLVGVERVAAELEGGALGMGAARLPVDEHEAALPRPVAEVGRDPDRGAFEAEDLRPVLDGPVLGLRLADLGEERQAEEVPETLGDVPAERLPRLGLQVDPVLVLEERRRLRIVAVAARLGRAPLTAHPLDDVADEGLRGKVAAVGEGVEGHLDGVVHGAAGPLLPRRELLQDVEAADLLRRRGVPAAPRAVVMVEVLPLALLEGVVAAPRPGEIVRELRHRRHCRTTAPPPPADLPRAYFAGRASTPALATWPSCGAEPPLTPTAPKRWPSSIIGTPPSMGTAPVRPRSAFRPPATASSKALVGRLNMAADFAFWMATSMLPARASSARCR